MYRARYARLLLRPRMGGHEHSLPQHTHMLLYHALVHFKAYSSSITVVTLSLLIHITCNYGICLWPQTSCLPNHQAKFLLIREEHLQHHS